MKNDFDYIIVGAGSAGCVLANRLSQDPDVSVLIVEAGGSDDDARISTPASFGALPNTRFDWAYRTVPQPELNNRQIGWPRGRVIGGTGSINYMIYLRGHPWDYDNWAALGCEGWAWQDVLPYFRRLEAHQVHQGPLHGSDGPINIANQPERYRLTEMFIEACQERGIPFNRNLNGMDTEGCGYFPATTLDNERCSSARGYLHPAAGRENLKVESGAHVVRVVVEGGRATGIDYLLRGQSHRALAAREVIVSAGAVGSPQLLLLSGIGSADEARGVGLDVVHDLPGVGRNLQDHFHYRTRFEITEPLSNFGRTAEALAAMRYEYDNARTGPLTTNHFESGALIYSRDSIVAPDLEIIMIPYFISLAAAEYGPPDRHGFTISGFPLRPDSRGMITLASDDPLDRPVIDPRYLSEPEDMRLTLELVKQSREIGRAQAFEPVLGTEISPGAEKKIDAELIADIRAVSSTSFHPVGTCKMGSDKMAVVDAECRVHGVTGLRVVDASVMPVMVSGHPNAATMMIAEKMAASISAPG